MRHQPRRSKADLEEPLTKLQGLVAWHGNFYSVPPGHAGQQAMIAYRLGALTLDVVARGTVSCQRRAGADDDGDGRAVASGGRTL